ncbi:hypothetical protein OSTOST_18264, partial [Ostertagia ostertagi]
ISTYRYDVKLDVEKQGDTFKPGLTYNVVVALKQMDDTPVKANVPRRVQVTTFYNYPFNPDSPTQHEDKEVKIVDLDAHGTTVLALQPPLNCTSARIEIALYETRVTIDLRVARRFNDGRAPLLEVGAPPNY